MPVQQTQKLRHSLAFALSACIILPVASLPVQAAQQTTLMDLLFKNRKPEKPQIVVAPAAPAQKAVARKPIKKIAPPTFRDYQPESVRSVDLSGRIKPQADDAAIITGSTVPTHGLPMLGLAGAGIGSVSFLEALPLLSEISIVTERSIEDTLVAHYSGNPKFLWISGFDATEKAKQLAEVLADAASFGLNPQDYAVQMPMAQWSPDAMAQRSRDLMAFELSLSTALLRYIRDVDGRRIDANKLSGFHDLPDKTPDLGVALNVLATDIDPSASLLAYHPQEPEYQQLRAELKSLRGQSENAIVIGSGTLIRPGQSNAEFPKFVSAIKANADLDFQVEFGNELASFDGSQLYSDQWVPMIKAWQKVKGLGADGVIGPRTIAATVGHSLADRVEKVELALERMRWLPDSFGGRYVFINQPAYEVTYFNNDKPELTMGVVVGSARNQTTFFYDTIDYVEFNPTWGIPRSILVNEYLPKLRANPSYLDAKGYHLYNGSGQRVSSSAVNWSAQGSNAPFNVVQPPGPRNALGELKIMFPNKHAIYMHDTPSKSLFARATRALSHGCVRLSDPRAMAAAVLGIQKDDIGAYLASGKTNRKNLAQKMPVFLTYMTAWPDENGKVQYFDDMYSRDLYLTKAIEKTEAARGASS